MSLNEILRLRRAPKRIERYLPHLVTCPSLDNRMSIMAAQLRSSSPPDPQP